MATLLMAVLLLGALGGGAARFVDGPFPGMTGGFGEPTCHHCHFDSPVNAGAGRLRLIGVPEFYTPGRRYVLTVRLTRPEMAAAGFQIAARFAAGNGAGRPAGSLRPVDERTQIVEDAARGQTYIQQTRRGSEPVAGGGAWKVAWTAPARAAGVVIFHAAANAANGDQSPLGDFIYTTDARVRPVAAH